MKVYNIALLGFGTVGQGVWHLLKENGKEIENAYGIRLEIKKILVPSLEKDRGIKEAEKIFTTDFSEIEKDEDISLIVEVIGKSDKTIDYMERSLKAGKHLVTANKDILAKHGLSLYELAKESSSALKFEAAVCGAIPIIKVVRESLSANQINRIMGIMNGTSNYILTKMEKEGMSFDMALRKAQELGYAESDPTDDVKGFDAANKICILASLAFHSFFDIDKLLIKGIDRISEADFKKAEEENCTIKLIAGAEKSDEGIKISVKPCFIKKTHPLATINDAFNAVFVDTNCAGEITISGKGAGSLETASAVVADCIETCLKGFIYSDYPLFTASSGSDKQVDISNIEVKDFEIIG